MDTITHALLGAAASDAIFGKKLGRTAAIGGALAGVLPDFDMVASFGGSWNMLEWHRSFTHSFFVLPFLAGLSGLFFWRFLGKKKQSFLPWYLLCFFAILLHIILDLCTSWGTEALWPISPRRFAWDNMPIIDPFFTLPLFIWAVLRLFKKLRPYSSQIATTAFAWCFAYCMGGVYMNERAQDIARDNSEYPQQQQPLRTRAIPQPGSIFLWNVVNEYPDNTFTNLLVSTFNSSPLSNLSVFKGDSSPQTQKVLSSKTGKLLLRSSQGFLASRSIPVADTESAEEKERVQLLDMRYTFPNEEGNATSIFTSEAVINPDNTISFQRRNYRPKNPGRFLKGFKHIFTAHRQTAPPSTPSLGSGETPAEID